MNDLEPPALGTGAPDTGLAPPHMNTTLVGHGEAERLLLDAWNSGRMPHAWLFTGPPGIGKATLAFRLAQFVLSQSGQGQAGLFGSPPTADSLTVTQDAPAARLIAAQAHPDLRVLRRRANDRGVLSAVVRVEDVRAFGTGLHLKSAEGGWRVAIVDEGNRMHRSAETALLKILEEPPSKTLIIIISNTVSSLLPTTRSRCRRLMLSPLAEDQIATLLARARPDLSGDEFDLLVRLSEGSIGHALALAEVGGAELYRRVVDLMAGLPAIDGERLHAAATAWVGRRRPKEGEVDRFEAAGALVLCWIDRAIRAANHAPGLREYLSGDLECAVRFVERIGVEAAFRRRDAVRRLFRLEPALNLERKQVLIDAIHTLAMGDDLQSGQA